MKSNLIKRFGSLTALVLLLAGCGGGGGGSSDPPGALSPAGSGLVLDQAEDGGGKATVLFSSALDINDANEVVGFVEILPGEPFVAGLWTVNENAGTSNPTALPPLPGNSFSAAAAIDEFGNAVGRSADGSRRVAVLWPFGAALTPVALPCLTVTGNCAAYGVSADGTLIVGEAEDAAAITRAVIWVADDFGEFGGPPIVLPINVFSGSLGVSRFSTASGVAKVGGQIWVVGEAVDGGDVSHAALWRSEDGVIFQATDLKTAAESGSAAYAVNSAGRIVGESHSAADTAAILWVPDATASTFQRTVLAAAGTAVAINENGRVAGWSGNPPRATVWNGTAAAFLFGGSSQAYGMNNAPQPLVVGRNGDLGFVKRAN